VKLQDISETKKKEYPKAKIDEIETNSKIKNQRLVEGHKRFQEGLTSKK
jgi:hypothetical protein